MSSQVIRGFFGSAAAAFWVVTWSQVNAANSAARRGVTYARSLALVGLVLGVAGRVLKSEADGVGVADPTVLVDAAFVSRTARNSSFALSSMLLIVAWLGTPGMETTTFWAPCVLISVSESPLALTRSRMIDTAWFSWSAVGADCPFATTGCRMISVPPSRSSPSFGTQVDPATTVFGPPVMKACSAFTPARTAMMTRSQMRDRTALLTGVVFATGTLLSMGVPRPQPADSLEGPRAARANGTLQDSG